MLTPTLLSHSPDWVTSDNHFGHANIIKYTGRPWATVDAMNRAMIDRWNSVVSPGDTVLILGDLCMGKLSETLPIIPTLHGRKFLVPGNHDKCHPMYGDKAVRAKARYEEVAKVTVLDPLIRVALGPFGEWIYACHYPPTGESRDGFEDRDVDWRPEAGSVPILHGHVHSNWLQRRGSVNVGVDVHNFFPASSQVLAALLSDGPDIEDRPARPERTWTDPLT